MPSWFQSRSTIEFFKPYSCTIEDSYGESITLSKQNLLGDIPVVGVSEYHEDGRWKVISVTGKFHDDNRQSSMNFLAQLRSMTKISDQQDRSLIFICPHPQMQMRGRILNLVGPSVKPDQPLIYEFSFDFVSDEEPRQPIAYRPLIEILPAEGKDYVEVTIPSSDYTNLWDLAYAYYGQSNFDQKKIVKIISLNNFTTDQVRALTIGSIVKLPLS